MKPFLPALALTMLVAIPAAASDVGMVLASPLQRIEKADFRATGHLVRIDPGGNRTSDGISIKAHGFPDELRVLVEITSPAEARARILFEMRPKGKTMIRIAHPGDRAPAVLPFDKWSDGPLGSAFSYEDFLEAQYFWPVQRVVEQIKFGERDCNVLKSAPASGDQTHYSEVRTWLDRGIGFPVYAEKTLKAGGAVKGFTYLGLRQTGGVWSASQVEVKMRGQAGSTLLIIDRGNAKANLTLADFSPDLLTRF